MDWPTRESVISPTVTVVVVSLASAFIIGSVDFLFQRLFQALLAG